MKKFVKTALVAMLLFGFCVSSWAEQPPADRKFYEKNLRYNKNAFPIGWQYEVGYAVWRMDRKLPVNLNTYRMYRRDKAWRHKMHRYYRPQELLLNTIDWTTEEAAFFIQRNQDYLKFHPAGYDY